MFDDDGNVFGDLFDFDGDGETSFGEAFLAHEMLESDEVLNLEYGESDDGGALPLDEDDYDLNETDDGSYEDMGYEYGDE